MSAEQLQVIFLYVQLAQIAVTAIVGIWALVSRRSKVNASEIAEVKRDLGAAITKLTLMEQRVTSLPDQSSVGKIYDEIRKISSGMAGLEATVTAQGTSINRIADSVTDLLRHELATSTSKKP